MSKIFFILAVLSVYCQTTPLFAEAGGRFDCTDGNFTHEQVRKCLNDQFSKTPVPRLSKYGFPRIVGKFIAGEEKIDISGSFLTKNMVYNGLGGRVVVEYMDASQTNIPNDFMMGDQIDRDDWLLVKGFKVRKKSAAVHPSFLIRLDSHSVLVVAGKNISEEQVLSFINKLPLDQLVGLRRN